MSANEKEIEVIRLTDNLRAKVLAELPNVIIEKTKRDGKVNFSLFKSTITNGKVKFIPYGNLRKPYLINNSMLSEDIAKEISTSLALPEKEVSDVIRSIANEAKESLISSASYVIKDLCRIYMDSGKIRVSMMR